MKDHLPSRHSLEEALAGQMNLGVENSDAFFDPSTGEIMRRHDFSELSIDEEKRLSVMHLVPVVPSQETFLWMQEFAETVPAAAVRGRLRLALCGIGAIWKFRNVLYHHPAEALAWESFQQRKLVAFAREWLQDIDGKTL